MRRGGRPGPVRMVARRCRLRWRHRRSRHPPSRRVTRATSRGPDVGAPTPTAWWRSTMLVVTSPDLARTISALQAVGLEPRRTRDHGAMRQTFFRLGPVILELVGPPAAPTATGPPASGASRSRGRPRRHRPLPRRPARPGRRTRCSPVAASRRCARRPVSPCRWRSCHETRVGMPEVDELRRREAMAREMGGPEKVERQHDGGPPHRARAHRRAARRRLVPRGRRARRARHLRRRRRAHRVPPGQLRDGPRAHRRPARWSSAATTSRCGAARPTRRSAPKQVHAEQMAHELRLPIVRLVDGTGGGGSVKSLETMGRTYVPLQPGLGVGRRQPGHGARGGARPRPGRRPRRGARRHQPLLGDGARHRAGVRGRAAGGGPPGREVDKEELGGSHIHGRNGVVDDVVDDRAGGVRAGPPVPLVPAVVGARAAAARRRATTTRTAATTGSSTPSPATGARSTRCGRSSRPSSTTARSSRSGAVAAAPRSPGWPASTGGRWPCSPATPTTTAAGWTADAAREGRPASSTWPTPSTCRSCTSSTSPGFVIGTAAERAATIRHGARALAAIYQAQVPWCSVILRKVFGVAGAAHQNAAAALVPLRVAVRRLGLAAARGRHRGRLQGPARGRPTTPTRCGPRSRRG